MPADPAKEKSTPAPRTPRAVINEAIRETAAYDIICWWGLVIFGLTGVITILAAVWQSDAGMGAVGAVPTLLCWPTIHYAISIRRGNVALRLLELALNDVKSSEQARQAISEAFGFHFGDGEGNGNVVQDPKTTPPGSGP